MKAAVLTGLLEIELRDVPDPVQKSDTDVFLKMAAVGVCGSDIHYYTKGRIGDQIVQYPFIVGHEGSAIVKEVGNRVTRVKSGDPVVFDPLVVCGQCSQCLSGRRHTCFHARFLGIGYRDCIGICRHALARVVFCCNIEFDSARLYKTGNLETIHIVALFHHSLWNIALDIVTILEFY